MRSLSTALLLWLCTSAGAQGQVENRDTKPFLQDALTSPTISQGIQNTLLESPLRDSPTNRVASPFPGAHKAPNDQIAVSYLEKSPVGSVNGEKSSLPTRFEYRILTAYLDLNCDLAKIELTGDGKRAAVQTITAARHKNLLQALKDAKTEAEKAEAAKKLEENYRAHYAIETAWREERIAELEKRIEEMRSQAKERATSEEKYVEAAMTLAKLHAQGISAEPPKLSASGVSPNGSDSPANLPPTLSGPAVYPYSSDSPTNLSPRLPIP